MLNKFFFLITGLAGPLLLWPIEVLLPFPAIIEELFKLGAIWFLYRFELKNTTKSLTLSQLKFALLFGFLFSLTESILYLFNISLLNSFSIFPKRLLLTGIMHMFTTAVLLLGVKYKRLAMISSYFIAVGIHLLYNMYITSIL